MVQALDELEVGIEPSTAAITCSVPLRRRDEGAWTISGRARSLGGAGSIRARSIPGGITSASGTQRIAS